MYRTIILLLLGVFATTAVEAKKVEILAVAPSTFPPPSLTLARDSAGDCVYDLVAGSYYRLFAHVHRNTVASVTVVSETSESPLDVWSFTMGRTASMDWAPDMPFTVPAGESWSLAFVLESANGKGRLIDVMEMDAGECATAP